MQLTNNHLPPLPKQRDPLIAGECPVGIAEDEAADEDFLGLNSFSVLPWKSSGQSVEKLFLQNTECSF